MRNLTGYINTYEEAILLVHAIRLGCCAPARERLKHEDRDKIESGDIFCFIENESGMKRWTDGRIWSPSKISGEFLVYQEVPRHLSKNSLKKRRTGETNVQRKEDIIDRTTLHKKTISISFQRITYHIISYYRPIFANYSLINIPFFQKLSETINIFPDLMNDDYVKSRRENDPEFHNKYSIQQECQKMIMEDGKRAVLEQIAVEMLENLQKMKGNISDSR